MYGRVMTSTQSLNAQVATAIRVQLAQRNFTQAELAKMAGFTESTFSRRMTGEIPFTTEEIDKLAYILNMSVAELTNPVQR